MFFECQNTAILINPSLFQKVMVLLQHRSKKKNTGGSYKKQVVRRQHMGGSKATLTGLGEKKKKTVRTLGGKTKQRLLFTNTVNVLNKKNGKFTQATISTIVENTANRNFARRNIMTKGTVIDTSAGKARITNRPGQSASINAVLVE